MDVQIGFFIDGGSEKVEPGKCKAVVARVRYSNAHPL